MSERHKREAKEFALEMLAKEILYMKGRRREKAMRAYRRLLSTLDEKPMYFARS